jgi:hypothetical protein
MFVVVTVFAVWLGWELKFIRDRRAFLAAMDDLRTSETQDAIGMFISGTWLTTPGTSLPFWRRWLGDEPQTIIILPRTSSEGDRETAVRLFPEAQVNHATN